MLEQIRQRKAANPNYTVVDIGGRHNPWADDVVDVYVDVFPFETDKRLYVGDVNSEDIWRELGADGPFDFVIISHVLEDIRDPITGLNWLPRIAHGGFLGLPVKHREVANSKSGYWLGQSHHYWIFGVKNDDNGDPILIVVPKWHCVNYFNTNTPHCEPMGEEDSNLGSRTLEWFRPRQGWIRSRTRRHLAKHLAILGARLHPDGSRTNRTTEDGVQRWRLISDSGD